MDEALKEYIKSLIPTGFPDGRELVREGRSMAKSVPWNKSRFLKEYGYDTHLEYRKKNLEEGKQTYQLLMGLSTQEEELDGIREMDRFVKRTGFEVRSMQSIPSSLTGLAVEDREGVPKPTSYTMDGEEDWLAHTGAAPIDVCWQDWHLCSPNNLNQTIYALKAGTSRLGTFSTFVWEYPGYHEEKKRFSDMMRSMGILAYYKDEGMDCVTYPEDGMAGSFGDICSIVGYVMLEHYIVEELCGARLALSYGGLLSEILPRMALALAMEKLYGTPERPFVTYYNGSTNEQWNHDIETNYGLGASEMLIESIINLKYHMPTIINPVSITECLRVPTLDELFNIVKCGIGAERKAKEWLEFIDFTKFEKMRDQMIEEGTLFYNNVMDGFREAGVNMEDPLEMVMVLRHFDPVKFEQVFHPSISRCGHFVPTIPTVLGKKTKEMEEKIVADLTARGYEGALRGKRLICASADGHSYGLGLIENVWTRLGAEVTNLGTNMEASFVLDAADEEGTEYICVSIHCGQCYDYAKQLKQLTEKRGRRYRVLIGGMLNAMLPGNTEPVDVADQINAMGFLASNDFTRQVEYMLRS